ncbi:hypothetical protein D0525_24280 [Salmonella enterica]|uniref:hypothetical protein n=1 Tax=Salmonella enterica TaxID=28901 RepID=UPI001012D6E9|nr:hypothetical protein [Salmonella enterica]RXO32001.1 hypothetical protein D0525_24280 [Salmonella enterica]
MNNITELSDSEFSLLIKQVLPFLYVNPVSGTVCIHAEACKNGIGVNYISSNVEWENFSSLADSLKSLYNELFKEGVPSGKLLFFYPFSKTRKGNHGVIFDASCLYDFLVEKHLEIYPEIFNVEMFSFGFYFLEQNMFYGMEHPDFLYTITFK